MWFLSFYKALPAAPPIEDKEAVDRRYRRTREIAFLSILIGYSMFYVCRLAFSVAKKPMLDDGVLTVDQMGSVGAALFFTYAFGKFVNGFLTDWTHLGRLMTTGLLGSSILVFLFGIKWPAAWVFIVIWGLHGWFQSMGSAPSGAILANWFSNRERGTRYGIWSISHSVGSAFTFAVTSLIVAGFGWQWGFWAAGGICIFMALILFVSLPDRPRAYGLPPVSVYKNDISTVTFHDAASLRQDQWAVIRNPYLWILGLSSASMYIARYAMENWGVLYLQEVNAYTLVNAGFLFFVAKIVETVGTACCGFISDSFFQSRRNITTLAYGVTMIVGMVVFFYAPSSKLGVLDVSLKSSLDQGVLDDRLLVAFKDRGIDLDPGAFQLRSTSQKGSEGWVISRRSWSVLGGGFHVFDREAGLVIARQYHPLHLLGASVFGFGVGGLIALLGGLIAIDICPKRVSGAAMGMIGMFSYLGASCQERITGKLLSAGESVVAGTVTHDFSTARLFWIGAAVASVLFYCMIWNVKARE